MTRTGILDATAFCRILCAQPLPAYRGTGLPVQYGTGTGTRTKCPAYAHFTEKTWVRPATHGDLSGAGTTYLL